MWFRTVWVLSSPLIDKNAIDERTRRQRNILRQLLLAKCLLNRNFYWQLKWNGLQPRSFAAIGNREHLLLRVINCRFWLSNKRSVWGVWGSFKIKYIPNFLISPLWSSSVVSKSKSSFLPNNRIEANPSERTAAFSPNPGNWNGYQVITPTCWLANLHRKPQRIVTVMSCNRSIIVVN